MNNSGPRSAPLRARILAVLFQTKRAEVPWRVLLRNTLAAVLPLAIGMAAGRVGIGLWISVGAIVTMYSDQPGPYRQRLARLLAVSAAGGFAAFVGMVLGAHLAPLLGAALVISFAGALLVVFGDAGGRVGMAAIILLVITAASPAPGAWAALESAALIAAGGLLLTLFSIAAWPLQRYGPEREALASVYHGLAALARQRSVDSEAAPALSEGMTELQHTLLGSHRARGPVMDSFGVLLEESERIRLQLTALADGGSGERIGELVRADVADLLDHIGRFIASGADVDHAMTRSLQALRSAEQRIAAAEGAPAEGAPGSAPAAAAPDPSPTRHFHALCGQLAAAARNAARASAAGAQRAAEEDLQLPRAIRPQSPLSILLASLTPRSAAFRHALRTAVCVVVALWLGRVLELSHGYWIPMTVAIVLRADYGATVSYGLLRVAGTVMGLLLTTALVHFLPASPWAWLAAMAVLCAAYRYYGPVHYGVAVAALSGMVVLLLALAGEPPDSTMVPRLIATVIGSAMALTAFGLWPTRERTQIRAALAGLLRAYAAYLASLGAPHGAQERREARNAARVARANAEAALERLQAEPTASPMTAELTRSLLANSNRLARTTMTLEAALTGPAAAPAPAPGGIQALTAQGAGALERIAEAVERKAPPPPLSPRLRALQRELARELDTCASGTVGAELAALGDRLVDNINTLGHIVARAQGVS